MRLIKISKTAEILGVTPQTLRKWAETGELPPDRISAKGTRYWDQDKIEGIQTGDVPTIGYARVSSHDQKADLERQIIMLETYCAAKGWRTEVISDLGSGMNYRKKGLQRLIDMIIKRQIRRLVVTHKDRLLRFGSELVFAMCEIQGIELVIIHQGEQPAFEEELAQDVLEIITVFSARLYGSRSRKNRKLMEAMQAGADQIAEQMGLFDVTTDIPNETQSDA